MCDLAVLQIPILLASASPRRKSLLEEAGFNFRIRPSNISESYPKSLAVALVPEFLAKQKARSVISAAKKDELILAADSMVIHREFILGKPANRAEAEITLKKLSDTVHEVITGVSLIRNNIEFSFSVKTEVEFYPLTLSERNYYIGKYIPFDKAGSYGIQDWIGICRAKRINGSYTNVMGLPMARLYQVLQEKFI